MGVGRSALDKASKDAMAHMQGALEWPRRQECGLEEQSGKVQRSFSLLRTDFGVAMCAAMHTFGTTPIRVSI